MATKFYATSTASPFTPGFKGSWTSTNGSGTLLARTPTVTTVSGSGFLKSTTSPESYGTAIFVSDQLAAQTISGTVDLALFASEGNIALDATLKVHIWVSVGDSSTSRGTLLSNYVDTTEFALSTAGVQLAGPQTLTSLAIQNKDRIIIELGWSSSAAVSGYSATVSNGGNSTSAGDVVTGSTTASGRQSWISFSGTLTQYFGTRLYSASTTPSVTPSRQGSWTLAHATPYSTLARTRTSSTATTNTVAKTAATPQTGMCTLMVSPALSAQTISAPIDLCLRMSESSASNDMIQAIHAWVVGSDGTTVRGTLVNMAVDTGNELLTTLTGRSPLSPYTVSSVGAQDGDRLVIELGWSSPTSVSAQTGSVAVGSTTTTSDLTPGSTTGFAAPWVEIAQRLYFPGLKEITADGYVVTAVAQELTVTGTGLVQIADRSTTTDADGYVVIPTTVDLTAGAVLQEGDHSTEITADALMNAIGQVDQDVTADAIVFVADVATPVTGTGLVQDTKLTELTGSGLIILVPAVELTADGFITGIPDQTLTVTADATVVEGVETPVELTADALIMGPYEITADAIVTTAVGSGMLVATGTDGFNDPSDLVIALAERTGGTRFVEVASIQGYEFVAGFSTNITELAVAVDLSQSPTDPITLTISDSSDVELAGVDLDPAAWAGFTTMEALAGWLRVPLTSSLAVTSGSTYRITVAGEGKLLCTENASTVYGMSGLGVNVVVLSDTAPSLIDGRAMLLAGVVSGDQLGSFALSLPAGLPEIDTIILGPNVTVTLDPAAHVTLSVSRALALNPGSTLELNPSGMRHTISLAPTATMTVAGTLTGTGTSKTRATTLTTARTVSATVLLVSNTTGWLAGDRLYVETDPDGDGQIVTIASVAGNTVTLTSSLGGTADIGANVLNITRSVRITGRAPDQRPGFVIPTSGTLDLTSVELSALGTTTCVQPMPGAEVTLADVVISDLRVKTAVLGGTALDITPAGYSLTDITIVRAKIGAILRGSQTFGGTTYIAAVSDQNSGVKQLAGTVTMDLTAMQTAGGSVALSGGSGYVGSIRRTLGTSASSAFSITGAIGRSIELTDAVVTGVGTGNCLVRLGSGGGLYRLAVTGITTDVPYVSLSAGAILLGDGTVTNSTNFATTIATIASTGFIRLRDEDSTAPISVTGALMPGSMLATRDLLVTDTGRSGRATDLVYSGSSALFLVRSASASNHIVELARIDVSAGEAVTITAYAHGELTLTLDGPVAPTASTSHSAASWDPITVSTIAEQAGVLILTARTTSLSNGYLDAISRG